MLGWPYPNGIIAVRSRAQVDPRTKDPLTPTTETWEHCLLLDYTTTEAGSTSSDTDVVLMGPPDADVRVDDTVTVEGRTWNVTGFPGHLRSHLVHAGASRATTIKLSAVTGGAR